MNPVTNTNTANSQSRDSWCQKWNRNDRIAELEATVGSYVVILNDGKNDGTPAG
jgi:hypothetical protein